MTNGDGTDEAGVEGIEEARAEETEVYGPFEPEQELEPEPKPVQQTLILEVKPTAYAYAAPYGAHGPIIMGTSLSSNDILLGSLNFTMVEYGLDILAGARMRASSTLAPTNFVEGIATSFDNDASVLVIDSDLIGGSGNFTSWNINVSGEKGIDGDPGPVGPAGTPGTPGGPPGPVGPTGATGPQGIQGVQGPKGDQGIQGPQGVQGPTGPQGSTGSGIIMKGSVATSANLPPTGNAQGDAYIVQADDSLWIWDGAAWVSGGSIQGPPGALGPQGVVGPQGPIGLTGSQGIQGVQGPIGDTGATGPQGSQGPVGPTGPVGEAPIDGLIYSRKNAGWVAGGGGSTITISDTPPASPVTGSMWWESDSGLLYIYYVDPSGPPGQWVIAAPQPDLSTFIIKSGDTMTGPLVLPGNPTLNLQAATKQYVDGLLASPTLTGDPKAPTPSPLDNDTSIATTAFVTAALSVTTNISWIDLADAATIIVPGGVSGGFGRNFRLNPMAGNRTLGYLQTAVPGSTGIIAIKQDSVGSRTLSGLTSNGYFCDGDTAFAIGITANKWSLISYQVIDATHTFLQLVAVNVSLG